MDIFKIDHGCTNKHFVNTWKNIAIIQSTQILVTKTVRKSMENLFRSEI